MISISSTCHITRALAPKQKGHPHTRSWPQPCPEPHFLTKHDPDPDFEGPWYEVPTTKTLLLRVEYEDHRIELWYTEHSTPAPGAPSSIFVRNPPPPPPFPESRLTVALAHAYASPSGSLSRRGNTSLGSHTVIVGIVRLDDKAGHLAQKV